MGKALYVWPNGCSTQSCVKWNVLYYRHSTWACLDLISSSAVIPALASKWSSTPLPPVWVGSRQTWPVLISQYISYLTSLLFHFISPLIFYTNHLFTVFSNSLSIDDKWHNVSIYTMFQIRAGWNRKKRSCSNGKTRHVFINLWIPLNGTPILGSGKQSPARTLRRNARSVEYLQWTKVSFSRL